MLQGEKFAPHGAYVRRWVPEPGHSVRFNNLRIGYRYSIDNPGG
jgi:deoxyribodipyrimidine photolyase